MKILKRISVIAIALIVIATTSLTIYASSGFKSPVEVLSNLTGREYHSLLEERRDTGKHFWTIADEAGVLDQMEVEMLQIKREILDTQVAEGLITQQQADDYLNAIKDRHDTEGFGYGQRFGRGWGTGCGNMKFNGMRNHHRGFWGN